MKKMFWLVSLAGILATGTIISCQKDSSPTSSTKRQTSTVFEPKNYMRLSLPSGTEMTVANVGEWHNYLLDQLLLKHVLLTASSFDSCFRNNTSTLSISTEQYSYLEKINEHMFNALLGDSVMAISQKLTSQVASRLENEEDASALIALANAVHKNYGSEEDPVMSYRTDLESVNFSYSGDHELIAGGLDVAMASANYWATNLPPDIPGDIAAAILQADAAGYLVGWSYAWLVDQLDSPSDRIRAGGRTAWTLSGGRLLMRLAGVK